MASAAEPGQQLALTAQEVAQEWHGGGKLGIDLPSFKAAANFPSFKRLSEKDTDNECAFSTGSLINFFPFCLPPKH